MIAEPLAQVLEATGFLSDGQPAADSVTVATPEVIGAVSDRFTRLPSFSPDAWWRSNADYGQWSSEVDIKVYFKFVETPTVESITSWQKELWNQGFSPLLWVVSPEQIDLYNGFGDPQSSVDNNRLDTFQLLDTELERLDAYAGRLTMETGMFWQNAPQVNRQNTVDTMLLRHLGALEQNLVRDGLNRADAQGLIGRSIFAQYLIHRSIVTPEQLQNLTQRESLPEVLDDAEATNQLFAWLREQFNGDMFSSSDESPFKARHTYAVAEFLRGTDPESGQSSLFPYRFDIIPIELISAIYEQFVNAAARLTNEAATELDAHYTPITAVSLVLDEVFEGLSGHESVLDLTCGSGIFLVESMRRLVRLRSEGEVPSRQAVTSVLYNQIHGLDIMPEAVRIAAFSLYLAALELDPDPRNLRFQPLIGNTLRVGDAFNVDWGDAQFDVIVGNPPWSHQRSLRFLKHAINFGHEATRFGLLLSAMPFFSRNPGKLKEIQDAVARLAPVTLVNFSELSQWLFPNARMPAMALLASGRGPSPTSMTLARPRWSETSESSHSIEIAPSDVTTLPVASWKRNTGLFKASFLGRRHDLLLLDELHTRYSILADRLEDLGTSLRAGVKLGKRSKNASFLLGRPFASRRVRHFHLSKTLPAFDEGFAERPRDAACFAKPLVVVGEFLQGGSPRLVSAVSESDLVFSDSYFGASFADSSANVSYLVAGILGSKLASWYCLMTGSAFGIWIRRVKLADVREMPMPDLRLSIESEIGKRIASIAKTLHQERPVESGYDELDDAVFELYRLNRENRMVVCDGLQRATWQWKPGRLDSVKPAEMKHLRDYATAFLGAMDDWLSEAGRSRMRAEIIKLPSSAPLRIIRFVVEKRPGPSTRIETIHADHGLAQVLSNIGTRAGVRVSSHLVGMRDLRVSAGNEVSIIKPVARRNWLSVHALEDADAVVGDSIRGIGTQ